MRPDGGPTALCLVGSAAGPLPGDELELDLDVRPGAQLVVTATGATIAQGAGAVPAVLTTRVRVGPQATLTADPGALLVCAGATVRVSLDLHLDATAGLRWRELIVLGRTGEPPGAAAIRWDVTRGGRPLLRQAVDLTDPTRLAWPGLLRGGRVLLTELTVDPRLTARTRVHAPTAVTQRLADGAVLTTVLAHDVAEALATLDAVSGTRVPAAAGRSW